MSYQALYRKWRPLTFEDVRGQDAIVTTLKNQIRADRIGHAYLFCGTRGTGKTSVAKIFARAVNCPEAKTHDGSPCNECGVCRSILSASSMNVFEIDAASNNGVDNIRDIREQVEYPPTEGRYKVYIIDEVHMLSAGAFNALLKTLEEPPSYVIFILATTDPQKIPQTILSRCQRYDFRRIGSDVVAGRIHELMEAEKLSIEERAVSYIARAADGSMRDALSLLDQCIAFHYGKTLSYENVLDVLGAADTAVFSRLYRAVCRGEVETALSVVNDTVNAGREISQFTMDFIWYLRNVLLCGCGGSDTGLVDVSDEQAAQLLEDAREADKTSLLRVMSAMSELSNRMRQSAQRRILLEVELIRLCTAGRYAGAAAEQAGFRLPAPPAGAGDAKGTAAPELSTERERSNESVRYQLKEVRECEEAERPEPETAAALPERAADVPDAIVEETAPSAGGTFGEALPSASDAELLALLRENWESFLRALSPSNRAVFSGTVLKAEQPGAVTIVFKNAMNYRIAATDKNENGLKKLKELMRERTGFSVSFLARTAKKGEFDENAGRITDEDLLRIHFPVDME